MKIENFAGFSSKLMSASASGDSGSAQRRGADFDVSSAFRGGSSRFRSDLHGGEQYSE
jgi:hypothetical protein